MITKVASIFFAPVKADRTIYGKLYEIPAVPEGAPPYVLEIGPAVQVSQGPYSLSSIQKQRSIHRDLIASNEIARDIVSMWTTTGLGMHGTCHPGIWVVRDKIFETDPKTNAIVLDAMNQPIWRDATEAEAKAMWEEDLAHARAADREYGMYLIAQGDLWAMVPTKVPLIPTNFKLAARRYGAGQPWSRTISQMEVKHCPYCQRAIAVEAIVCEGCRNVVDPERYAQMQAALNTTVQNAKTAALLN